MPRNDLKAYETLTARIPQDLVDAARRYASLHRSTVSEVMRDSLQIYMDAAGPGRASDSGQEDRKGPTEVIQEVLRKVIQEVRQGHTEVIQEVRRGHASLVQALAALPAKGHAEVIHDANSPAVVRTEVLQGHTEGIPSQPAPLSSHKGMTEVVPFDTTKYVLGKLCPRKHAWGNTGKSLLRRTNRHCGACDREKFQERQQAKRQQVSA